MLKKSNPIKDEPIVNSEDQVLMPLPDEFLTPVTSFSSDAEDKKGDTDEIVSTDRLKVCVESVSRLFSINDMNFSVSAFKDSGNKVSISMSNSKLDFSVTFKSPEDFGIY